LLHAAQSVHDGIFLAYVSIALFAGLRPDSELGKLTWKGIGLKAKKMRVPAVKTRKGRAITISDNLCQWLEVCDRTKPIIPEVNFQRSFAAVKREAGFKGRVRDSKKLREIDDREGMKPWVPDYTRHTSSLIIWVNMGTFIRPPPRAVTAPKWCVITMTA